MPESVNVDSAMLWTQSQRLLDHIGGSHESHRKHTDDIADYAQQWNGEIKGALAHLAQEWTGQRAALHDRIGKAATTLATNSQSFAGQEAANQENIGTNTDRLA